MKQAKELAAEVEQVIRGADCERYFREMYGNEPDAWCEDLEGMPRWRVITNYFTRMRLVDADGVMNFSHKGALDDAPEGLSPWFAFERPQPCRQKILFGHWAALEGHTGDERFIGLDTGCVWGRSLTALRSGGRAAVSGGFRQANRLIGPPDKLVHDPLTSSWIIPADRGDDS